MSQKKLTIGLFGFGVVGEGIYQVLQKTPTLNAAVKKVCIKNDWKKRDAPTELFTTDANLVLNDPDINVIVELIDDADTAFHIVSTALKNGKSVVSANKKLIAEHLPELLALQQEFGSPFLYEAAVCGSIPVIRNLEEYYDNDLLRGICGVVNGSTNYILTRINEDGYDYKEALLKAQQLGFAESNPSLDVNGTDAANKLTILLAHAYGIISHPSQILYKGITQLHVADSSFADEKNYKVRLIAQARRLNSGDVSAFVLPQFIEESSQLFHVKNEYNGVVIESTLSDKQFLYGKGAGRFPTSSAVLSDISALRYGYKYEYRKLGLSPAVVTNDFYIKCYVSFDDWDNIDRDDFEWLEAYHSNRDRQYVVGVIHFEKLHTATWLENENVSLIAWPDGIIEEIETRRVKRRSLELAGVV